MNAIGDRSANKKVGDLVSEVIVSHQPKRVIWPRCKFEKLLVATEYQKQSIYVSNCDRRIQLEIIASVGGQDCVPLLAAYYGSLVLGVGFSPFKMIGEGLERRRMAVCWEQT